MTLLLKCLTKTSSTFLVFMNLGIKMKGKSIYHYIYSILLYFSLLFNKIKINPCPSRFTPP